MLSIAGLPPALISPIPIYTPGWREALWELSVLPKNTTQCPRPGLEPGPLDPETSALTMRPPRLPIFFNCICIKSSHITFTLFYDKKFNWLFILDPICISHFWPYINVMHGFVLFKFVKPYMQSVLCKPGPLHNTILVFFGLLAIILVFHSGIMPCSANMVCLYVWFIYYKQLLDDVFVITGIIIKITISSIEIRLKNSYFPLIHLPSCYRTACYWTVCYRTVQ